MNVNALAQSDLSKDSIPDSMPSLEKSPSVTTEVLSQEAISVDEKGGVSTTHKPVAPSLISETPAQEEAPKLQPEEVKTLLEAQPTALSEKEAMQKIEEPFKMQEYRPNYIISGKPDTKIEFSFLFRLLKNYNFYLGYTQTMFWELGQEDSNPFSDINYNPELFYRFKFEDAFFSQVLLGQAHTSNGVDGVDSRSMDEAFVQLVHEMENFLGITRAEFRFRYIWPGSLSDNKDLKDYYGPLLVRLHLTRLGRRLFFSEQLYVEYYNGGKWADDFSKSSVKVSFRFKLFESLSAPKFFIQYFNGYGENLRSYNQREESFRVGLSIGGV